MKSKRYNGYCVLRINNDEVLVDFQDVPKLHLDTTIWTVAVKGNTKYASMEKVIDGKRVRVAMHRVIMDFPELEVDHIDRNGLNNLRSNLRLTTHHKNSFNSPPRSGRKGRTSKYKGVSWSAKRKGWRATIQNGKWQEIGLFKDENDAARAYDKVARELFGPTAWLNCKAFSL